MEPKDKKDKNNDRNKNKESEKDKEKDKKNENSDKNDNQVWRNLDLIKAVSGILSEIINENKKDPMILNSKLFSSSLFLDLINNLIFNYSI
jgi:hypothetical protein